MFTQLLKLSGQYINIIAIMGNNESIEAYKPSFEMLALSQAMDHVITYQTLLEKCNVILELYISLNRTADVEFTRKEIATHERCITHMHTIIALFGVKIASLAYNRLLENPNAPGNRELLNLYVKFFPSLATAAM
jgi:hypothetical protein